MFVRNYISSQIRDWIRQEIRELFDDRSDTGNPNQRIIKTDLYDEWVTKYKVKKK